jgi:ribosomal protein S18 acetylase RimI-like enzyme
VASGAAELGHTTLWLLTTNDNLPALLVYQRHGFRLTRLYPGNVDSARELKPEIPVVGTYGIPVHDELVLERRLG